MKNAQSIGTDKIRHTKRRKRKQYVLDTKNVIAILILTL